MKLKNYITTLKTSLLKENLFTNITDKETLLEDTLSLLDLDSSTKEILKTLLPYEDRFILDDNGKQVLPVTFLCGKVIENGLGGVKSLENKSSRDITQLLENSSVEELSDLFKSETKLDDLMIATQNMNQYIKAYISILFEENPLLAPMLSKVFLDSFDSKKVMTKDLKTLFDRLTDFFYEDSFTKEDIAKSVGIYLFELLKDKKFVEELVFKVFGIAIDTDNFQKGTYYLKATLHPLFILDFDKEKKEDQIEITINFLQKEIFPQFKIALLKSDIIKKGMIKNYYNLFNNILVKDIKDYFGENPTTSYIKKSLETIDPFEREDFTARFFS